MTRIFYSTFSLIINKKLNYYLLSVLFRILRKLRFDKGYFRERALLFESNLIMVGEKNNVKQYQAETIFKQVETEAF